MKIQLLVTRWSPACERAACLWREVADARGFALEIVDVETADGRVLAERLNLATVPTLVIDDRPVATGVQSKEEARALVDAIFGQAARE
jgi:glutaredoxin